MNAEASVIASKLPENWTPTDVLLPVLCRTSRLVLSDNALLLSMEYCPHPRHSQQGTLGFLLALCSSVAPPFMQLTLLDRKQTTDQNLLEGQVEDLRQAQTRQQQTTSDRLEKSAQLTAVLQERQT